MERTSVCQSNSPVGYRVEHLPEVAPVACPCGESRRAFVSADNGLATMHLVDIAADARTHYHRRLTEIYYVLETCGPAFLELNGERIEVRAGTAVMIHPETRHRAIGRMKILNVSIPAFDPADEWFD